MITVHQTVTDPNDLDPGLVLYHLETAVENQCKIAMLDCGLFPPELDEEMGLTMVVVGYTTDGEEPTPQELADAVVKYWEES